MLPDTITLALPNGGTPVNKAFGRVDVFPNRSVYHGPAHTVLMRQTLGFYRTPSKRIGKFNGVMKSAAKVTLDIHVLNAIGETITSPQIGDLSYSIPVGATEGNVDQLFDHIEALVKDQRAIMKRTLFGPEI